jgi:hypothetical protein
MIEMAWGEIGYMQAEMKEEPLKQGSCPRPHAH